MPFLTLKQHNRFSKNHYTCKHENGIRQMNNCITYRKLTHLCLMLNHDDEDNLYVASHCGLKYDNRIEDSTQAVQEVDFTDYELEVEVRSSRDPHIRFG
jgi:hypothetical protein